MEELIQKALSTSNRVSKNSLIEKIIPVGGGCIHKAWCIHFQNGKKFSPNQIILTILICLSSNVSVF